LSCSSGQCVPSCSNGFQDGNETGIDCGGSCGPCGVGGGCGSNMDCVAAPQSSGGECGCQGGRGNCNGNPNDGCEVQLLNDPNNCNACGNVCNLPNANEMCTMGSCFIGSCNTGFADCNGMPADGCEASLQTDPNNCNACGN